MDFGESSSWAGRWRLTKADGFVEWLSARGLSLDEAEAEVDALERHTTLNISLADDVVSFMWISAVRWKLRKVKQVREYLLDGTTPLVENVRGQVISTWASIEGSTLVHRVDGFLGAETHLRDVSDGRLVQQMSLDVPTGVASDSCTLIWRRV